MVETAKRPLIGLWLVWQRRTDYFFFSSDVVWHFVTRPPAQDQVGRRHRFRASPPITSTIAINFHAGIDSPSQKLDAAMPKTGTSSAIGVTVAAG